MNAYEPRAACWPLTNTSSVVLVVGALLALIPLASFGQQQPTPPGTMDLRYDTLLKGGDRNKTTPGNEFGDQHGIESGSLSLNVVDISIPGNSDLAVEFRRTLKLTEATIPAGQTHWMTPATRMNAWAFGLPKIEAGYDHAIGWRTSDPTRPTKNCSVAQASYMAPQSNQPDVFSVHVFWRPATLHLPDGGSHQLIYRDGSMPQPTSGGPHYWLTSGNDYVACIASLKNSGGSTPEEQRFGNGEGYLLHRPDGTKYWFDWISVDRVIPTFTTTSESCGSSCYYMPVHLLRQVVLSLYPTRIEDRFGNWVKYTYSNKSNEYVKLDKIESSDGRTINVVYEAGNVRTVTANGRSWEFSGSGTLYEVENPDHSKWRYEGTSHKNVSWPFARTGPEGLCEDLTWTTYVNPDATSTSYDGGQPGFTVTSPSGAKAVFKTAGIMRGRSGVLPRCYHSGYSMLGVSYPQGVMSPFFNLGNWGLALISKEVSGPGLDTMKWKYNYQSDIGFLGTVDSGTSRTKILGPDGNLDLYTFGNTFRKNEGLLLLHERKQATSVKWARHNAFAVDGAGVAGYPKKIGLHAFEDADYSSLFLRPMIESKVVQDSRNFIWQAESFDEFARPVRVKKSSSPAP